MNERNAFVGCVVFMLFQRRRNSDIYHRLVAPMAEAGFPRDVNQIRTKWKHLQQEFKKEIAVRMRSGAGTSGGPHFDALHEILGHRALAAYPEEGVDSGVVTLEDIFNDIDDGRTTPRSSSTSSSPTPLPKRRKSKSSAMADYLQEMERHLSERQERFQEDWRKECDEQRIWEEKENLKFIKAQEEMMLRATNKFTETLATILSKK